MRPARVHYGPMTLDDIIREAIEDAVARNGGNKVAAAKELGIGKTTVYRLMNEYERGRRRKARKAAKKKASAKKKKAGRRKSKR